MIYPGGGTLRANYSDGTHVIHCHSVVVEAGQSVIFTSDACAGSVFRLGYRPIATGTLRKAG